MQHGGRRRCRGRHDTGAARTPHALLRRTHRAAASSLAVLRLRRQQQRYAPCSRFSPRRLPLGCARGNWFRSPPPSRAPQRYAPSSPPARKRSSVRCGRRIFIIPSFASPWEVYRTVHCQRSSRRTGQRGLTAGLPPPRAGLPATLTPPWSSATSRRCALGSLLLPHPPRRGTRCAAGYARCTDSFDVSGQAEGSIVTPENLSRARLAALGGCATLDRTCGAPAAA